MSAETTVTIGGHSQLQSLQGPLDQLPACIQQNHPFIIQYYSLSLSLYHSIHFPDGSR